MTPGHVLFAGLVLLLLGGVIAAALARRRRLSGYVAHPSQSRGNTRMQYLFLNGRHIRDRALQHALGEAYRGLLTSGAQEILRDGTAGGSSGSSARACARAARSSQVTGKIPTCKASWPSGCVRRPHGPIPARG